MESETIDSGLVKEPTDKDLVQLAECIGSGWQALAPFLDVENITVQHIDHDNRRTVDKITELLRTWRENTEHPTLGKLFHKMFQAQMICTWDISLTTKKLKIEEKVIRSCKGKSPLKTGSSEQPVRNIAPKDSCFYDGRLINLSMDEKQHIKENCKDSCKVGEGGFGKVYKYSSKEFGMEIAIKKIHVTSEAIRKSVRKERFASRILHPFIVPLLSMFEDQNEVYIITPYFERCDLEQVLYQCRENKCQLNQVRRSRIALQIGIAIQYLHTAVPNVRGTVLHKDISTSNIVLDSYFNARLIDFGLAREKDAKTSTTKGTKLLYLHPECGGAVSPSSVVLDYYSFGVVLRELLTNLTAEGKDKTYLKFMKEADIKNFLTKEWPVDNDATTQMIRVSEKCLNSTENFDFKVEAINALNKVLSTNEVRVENKEAKDRCILCLINPSGSEAAARMKHQASNCSVTLRICVSCEKNSFLNPVSCYMCGTQPSSVIGKNWAALLVAGNDQGNNENAVAFKQDIEDVKKVLVSRAPLIMGIHPENIQMVVTQNPEVNGKELVVNAIQNISRMQTIDTLLVYISCHGGKGRDNVFQLTSKNNTLSTEELQTELLRLHSVQRFIIILDRCFGKEIELKGKKVVQINACGGDEAALVSNGRSVFTKHFLQGLKARSVGGNCKIIATRARGAHIRSNADDTCKQCERYRASVQDYINVGSLFEYINEHMKLEGIRFKPQAVFKGNRDDFQIAYFTDEEICLDFKPVEGERKLLPLGCFQDMKQLEAQLCQLFAKADSLHTVDVMKDTGRTEGDYELCDSLEKMMDAWVNRLPLYVKFKRIS